MAKLPSANDLGGFPPGGAQRPIASYDVTGYAEGAGLAGRAIERGGQLQAKGLGEVGKDITSAGRDVAFVQQQKQDEDNKLDLARARAEFLTRKTELDAAFANDQDYTTAQDRYSKALDDIKSNSAGLIRNPRAQELFSLGVADDVARGVASAGLRAHGQWKDATAADATSRLSGVRDAALKSADPVERTRLIDSGNNLIDSLADRGIISREAAVAQKQAWAKNYAEAALSSLPAAERVSALGGFQGALAGRESSGRPTLVNDFGYAGLYQFGAERLKDLGLYTPGPNEDLATWSKTGRSAAGKWSGTFDIPGHPEVRTLQDFLQSTDAQRIAFGAHNAQMEREIDQNGLGQYVGKTLPDGTPITREGIKAMIHLGGVGGARAVLQGKESPRDAYGTSVSDYAKLGLQSDNSRLASLVPEQDRQRMLEYAQGELLQGDRQHRLEVAAAKEASDQEESAIFARIHTNDPNLSLVDDILKNPTLTREAKERMTQQFESRGKDRPEALYGKDFYDIYRRVHLPEDDPAKISNPDAIYPMVQRGSGLTPAGADRIIQEIRGKKTAEGEAEKQLMAQFFKNARGQISGTNEGLGIHDPKGDELFQRFQVQAFQAYDEGRKAGKSPYVLLNPDSPDYVGKSVSQYKRPTSEWFSDVIDSPSSAAPVTAPFDPNTVKSADELIAAYSAGKVDRATAQRIAIDRGWAVRKTSAPAIAPPISGPSQLPQVPMSE